MLSSAPGDILEGGIPGDIRQPYIMLLRDAALASTQVTHVTSRVYPKGDVTTLRWHAFGPNKNSVTG